jgi:hypothetical protein
MTATSTKEDYIIIHLPKSLDIKHTDSNSAISQKLDKAVEELAEIKAKLADIHRQQMESSYHGALYRPRAGSVKG